MIRNLFFDLDDTLLDFRRAERCAVAATLASFGVPVDDAILDRYAAVNAGYWRRLERHEVTRDELKVFRFRDLFEACGIRGVSPAAVTHAYEEELGNQPYLLPGARELLARLSGHYRLFAASNGTGKIQRARLADAGIADRFEALFISEEIGAEKPSAAFFDAVFARCPDLRRGETAIIGDSLTSDIAGGRAAGLRTVWFNPHDAENRTGIHPDAVVRSLDELEAGLQDGA